MRKAKIRVFRGGELTPVPLGNSLRPRSRVSTSLGQHRHSKECAVASVDLIHHERSDQEGNTCARQRKMETTHIEGMLYAAYLESARSYCCPEPLSRC